MTTANTHASGKGFFATAIADWTHLFRALGLVLGLLVLAILFLYSIYALAKAIKPELFVDNVRFSSGAKGPPLNISFGSKSVSVVNVPAYRFWTPTGIRLSRDTDIKIYASGLVSTGTEPPTLKKGNSRKESIGDLENRLIAFELDRRLQTGWRDPNGQPLHPLMAPLADHVDDCALKIANKTDSIKLDRTADYGALLGFVVQDAVANKIDDLLGTKKIETLQLGANSEIKYDATSNQFIVYSELYGKPQYIPASYENEMLYLTVNNPVINNEFDMDYPCRVDSVLEENRERQKAVYKMLHDPKYIWYLDNSGSFLVTLDQEPADK